MTPYLAVMAASVSNSGMWRAASGSFRNNNAEMLRAAALDGIGITAPPTWAVTEQLRSGMLQRVLTTGRPQ
jgi:DNA-binding transcriptional LysR family regulator